MEEKLYAGYPLAYLLEEPRAKSERYALLWGDTMVVQPDSPKRGGYVKVRSRGRVGYVAREQTQEQRLLDVIFLDVGQGDSAVMVTPAGDRVLIDFGQSDHAFRYLRWRYRELDQVPFAAAILSHGDEDHYLGLSRFCEDDAAKFSFATLFHNGLVADAGVVAEGGSKFYSELVQDRAALAKIAKTNQLAKWLRTALERGRFGELRMLSAAEGGLPGLAPARGFGVEVLAPLLEHDRKGRPRLRRFGDFNQTKNGHSVILKITYGDVRLLLGGDLNSPGQAHLLAHYGQGLRGAAAIEAASQRLEVDVVKAFHHGGSEDTRTDFFQALRPVATVISSGDEESYSHPRADALGVIGRWSRSDRPLLFSTELARTSRPLWEHPAAQDRRAAKPAGGAKQERKLDSAIARYGAINLRTDGRRMIFGQRLEKGSGWDLYALERKKGADWTLVRAKPGSR
jgi:hypothetical protein